MLSTELRHLDAEGHLVDALLPQVIRAGNLDDVDDLGSLLRYRMQRVTSRFAPSSRGRQLIAGIVPKASGHMDPEMERALAEREKLITVSAVALAHQAAGEGSSWADSALPSSADAIFLERLTVVAAYRVRYGAPARTLSAPSRMPTPIAGRMNALVALRDADDAPPTLQPHPAGVRCGTLADSSRPSRRRETDVAREAAAGQSLADPVPAGDAHPLGTSKLRTTLRQPCWPESEEP